MKRKKHIDDASRKLANALRDLDDAMQVSNGMQRVPLLTARRIIQNARELLQEAQDAP